MPGKSDFAPGLLGETMGDAWVSLLDGNVLEFVLLAIILSTVGARLFSGLRG